MSGAKLFSEEVRIFFQGEGGGEGEGRQNAHPYDL